MENVKDLVFKLMEQVETGDISLLHASVSLHKIQKDLEAVAKEIANWKKEHLDQMESEASEYPDGFMGYTFEFRAGGKIWNFKDIPEWNREKEKMKELEAKYKMAYESVQKGITPVDEYGEVLPCPKVGYRSSSVILKEKK